MPLLKEAQLTVSELNRSVKWRNAKSLLVLLGPVLPTVLYTGVLTMLLAARARFHQIGPWQSSVDAAAAGDMQKGLYILLETLAGHWIIHFVSVLQITYAKRAEIQFGQRVRSGVLTAMLRQDFSYFEKAPPGVL